MATSWLQDALEGIKSVGNDVWDNANAVVTGAAEDPSGPTNNPLGEIGSLLSPSSIDTAAKYYTGKPAINSDNSPPSQRSLMNSSSPGVSAEEHAKSQAVFNTSIAQALTTASDHAKAAQHALIMDKIAGLRGQSQGAAPEDQFVSIGSKEPLDKNSPSPAYYRGDGSNTNWDLSQKGSYSKGGKGIQFDQQGLSPEDLKGIPASTAAILQHLATSKNPQQQQALSHVLQMTTGKEDVNSKIDKAMGEGLHARDSSYAKAATRDRVKHYIQQATGRHVSDDEFDSAYPSLALKHKK